MRLTKAIRTSWRSDIVSSRRTCGLNNHPTCAQSGWRTSARVRPWHDVLPEPGTLLVNLGDLLAEWANDRWRSTLHRVVPPTVAGPARRRSVAFFQEANYDALISVMPTCVSDDNPARYTPVIAGEHLMNKLIGPRTLQRSTAVQTSAASALRSPTDMRSEGHQFDH